MVKLGMRLGRGEVKDGGTCPVYSYNHRSRGDGFTTTSIEILLMQKYKCRQIDLKIPSRGVLSRYQTIECPYPTTHPTHSYLFTQYTLKLSRCRMLLKHDVAALGRAITCHSGQSGIEA